MIKLIFPPGFPHDLEVHIRPDSIEYWRWGGKILELTPPQYGMIHRAIEEKLRSIEVDQLFVPYKPEKLENRVDSDTGMP